MSENLCPCCHRPLPSVYEQAIADAKLTAQERLLFLAVASGAGEPVPHRKLVDALWGHIVNGGPVDTATHIRVVARRTNAKIASVGYRLSSIYAVGYRLTTIVAEAA